MTTTDPPMPTEKRTKPIAIVVITVLGVLALIAEAGGLVLVRDAMNHPSPNGIDAVVVGLIGQVFAVCTTAIGIIGGSLMQMERHPGEPSIAQAEQVNINPKPEEAKTDAEG